MAPLSSVLALESGGATSSVALLCPNAGLVHRLAESGQSHSSQLLPMAQALLAQAGSSLADVQGLVVGVGPGSFTGLRIAVGVAQGMALGADKPVLGISGFDLWAYLRWTASASASASRMKDAAIAPTPWNISFDARLGERFYARLALHQQDSRLVIEQLDPPQVVNQHDPRCGKGTVSCLWDPDLAQLGLEALPMAAWMARFAADPACEHHHHWQKARELRPLYVRDKVAQTIAERKETADLMWSPMTERDLASVMVIEQQSYACPWTSGNFLDSLRAGYTMRVLKENGVMIGYMVWMSVVDEAHLLNLTLSPARQGRGLGSWMMRQFMDQVRQAGLRTMLLEVRPSNSVAIGLYAKHGFREIGRRKGYYPHSTQPGELREDALVMQLVQQSSGNHVVQQP